jgi:hypothetical protein
VAARFIDPRALDLTLASHGAWLAEAGAVIVHFSASDGQVANLARAGFTDAHPFPGQGRPTTAFLRRLDPPPGRGDPRRPRVRARLRRLVIVDPCLGAAAGHYERYARMLTLGAHATGLDVAWACHARFDARAAPSGVAIRPCFARCFFDLAGEPVGAVDLSGELARGWRSLLDEFDGAGTHFLMHSADAHQLRAAAAVLETGPEPGSVIHINFQTSPRFMPGRLAGVEAHRAVLRLRNAPQWEDSLFFWAETRRLGLWLSQWLGEEIPALPFLTPWAPGAVAPARRPGARPTLSFLGEGRSTKGFLDLPDIVDEIAATPGLGSRLKVVIQNWPPFRVDTAAHDQALGRLSRHPFVEIVDGVLEADAYDRRLRRSDMLLLPYDPATYDLQGSGILTEGFSHGAVILARAGMAIEDEAGHGVMFTYRTPQELVEVLAGVLHDFDDLSRDARIKAERFRAEATAQNYIAALDTRARGLAPAAPPPRPARA